MKLQYITDDSLADLKGNFKQNFLLHYLPKDGEYFQKRIAERNWLQDTSVEIQPFVQDLQVTSTAIDNFKERKEAEKKDDIHNAICIHKAMVRLLPYLAMDEHIWAALTHTVLFDFITRKRADIWAEEKTEKQKKDMYNSFFTFTHNGKRRGTFVNCIASLWWGAQMVYDSRHRENPYWLVPDIALTGYPSTIMLFSSSRIMTNKNISLGLFRVVHALRQQGIKISRQDVVAGIRYLNLLGGMSIIDMKTEKEIEELMQTFYEDWFVEQEKHKFSLT
ncbi:DUF6339 family protein [Mitsuokella sp. WILCCON 0060]|uniref:DUF6339 family protein n=1 Tax=Mitsuokella sp. WILCCON 0060 TaxID=3345341 RepID=UPI003F19FD0D